MRLFTTLGVAGALIAAALVGGTLIGSAFAADETGAGSGTTTSAASYCDVFMDTLAGDLGVTREFLVAAGQSAANAAIDAAVEAGDLSEERAETLRGRVAEADGSCGWFGGKAFGHGIGRGIERGMIRGIIGANLVADATEILGLDRPELLSSLREHGSLEAVAAAQGVPYDQVRATILAAIQERIEDAVADGLAEERADAALERVTAWLDEGGEIGSLGAGRGPGGHRHGPGLEPGWGDGD